MRIGMPLRNLPRPPEKKLTVIEQLPLFPPTVQPARGGATGTPWPAESQAPGGWSRVAAVITLQAGEQVFKRIRSFCSRRAITASAPGQGLLEGCAHAECSSLQHRIGWRWPVGAPPTK